MTNQKIPIKEGELIKAGRDFSEKKIKVDLFKSGILGEFIKDSGQYVILPQGTIILNKIRKLLFQYVQTPLGFQEVVLPKIAPVGTFRKADILRKWDDYLISVKPFSATKGVKEEYLMDPLQCTTFYQFFEDKKVDVNKSPIKWVDCSGPTYRNEDLDRLEPGIRQREFHRAEFIYLGTRKQVIETREKCLAKLELLCRRLKLKYRIVVGSGCFQLKSGEIRIPESEEEIPIKDLEIYIPHQKRWLEIAGSSVLAEIMTSRFNIKGKNGRLLWSGCTGIGLNRFMHALIATHGVSKVRRMLR